MSRMNSDELMPLVEHAIGYAEDGLLIFPVNPLTKRPLTSQKEATTDTEIIRRWWAQWPNAAIGCRVAPTQIILDIDPRHGGHETWKAIREETGPIKTRLHYSGRGDKGGHLWFQRPAGALSIKGLNDWARSQGLGQAIDESEKWTSGIDLLTYEHRYSILPPSPHMESGKPYYWAPGNGLDHRASELPTFIVDLLVVAEAEPELPKPAPSTTSLNSVLTPYGDDESPADWYSTNRSWTDLLSAHGWTLVSRGSGDLDGALWKHPTATAESSASIKNGCLFVYSPRTPFDETGIGEPNGYTLFRAYAVLEHGGDQSDAARRVREMMPKPSAAITREVDPGTGEIIDVRSDDTSTEHVKKFDETEHKDLPKRSPSIQELLAEPEPDYDWLVDGVLERGDRLILTGPEGGGKSTLMRQMATQMAAGVHPFELLPIAPLRVLYVDLENSKRHVKREFAPLKANVTESLGSEQLLVEIRPEGIDLTGEEDPLWLEQRIAVDKPDVLFIGPLYKLADGDPTEEKVAKRVATTLDRLRTTYGFALIMEAHSPHANQGKRPERPYGASLWVRWPEFGLHLAKEGNLRHWRGARDEREWPALLTRGGRWPWTATSDNRSVTFATILAYVREHGAASNRDLEVALSVNRNQIQRAISANKAQYDAAIDEYNQGSI